MNLTCYSDKCSVDEYTHWGIILPLRAMFLTGKLINKCTQLEARNANERFIFEHIKQARSTMGIHLYRKCCPCKYSRNSVNRGRGRDMVKVHLH